MAVWAVAVWAVVVWEVAVPIMVMGFVAVAFIPGKRVRARMAEPHEAVVSADAVAHGI